MHSYKLRTAAIAAALIAMMSTFSTGATAEIRRGGEGINRQDSISKNFTNRSVNRGRNFQYRKYGNRSGRNYYNSRRAYGYNGYNSYNGYGNNYSNRRYGNGFGLYLDLGGSSGCSSYYRRWKANGSIYWRSRYYNCIG